MGEKITLVNNRKKKGLQLVSKVVLIVAIPMLLIVALGCLIGASEIRNVGEIENAQHRPRRSPSPFLPWDSS